MSSRKEKLHLLRQHVSNMQSQLKSIENMEKEGASKWNAIAQLREVSINRESKDYRRNNSKDSRNNSREALSGKKSPSEYPSTARIHRRDQAQNLLSQTLKDIINKIDNNYYKQKEPAPTKTTSCKASFNHTSYIGQRYRYTNAPNSPMATSKQSKLRTFQQKKTDTILNPEQSLVRGIKIVRKIQLSPDKMLTENPKSDPNLYLFTTQPVYIHKKSHLKNKNESSIVLSPSTKFMIPLKTANSQEKHLTSQKKHFQRHFEKNICSRYQTLQ